MILIIGGAYQGKEAYVREHFPDGCDVILDYHLRIRKQLQEGKDPMEEAKQLVLSSLNCPDKELVIVCDEIGSGVVPMDGFERQYRESTGRVCCYFAEESEKVIRVIAGIGTVIKVVSE